MESTKRNSEMNFTNMYDDEYHQFELGATKLSDDVYLFGYNDDYWFIESIVQKLDSGFVVMSHRIEYDGIRIKGKLKKLMLNNMIEYLNQRYE